MLNNKSLSLYYSFKKKPKFEVSCKNDYKIFKTTLTKRGAYGSIAEACKGDDCKYIVKAIPFKNLATKHSFMREALIAPMMDKINIAPKIYDIFVCLNVGYIIMDKWDGSYQELIKNYRMENNYLDEIIKLIKKMHSHNVMHNDLHLDNILYKKKKGKYIFCLNDFGHALYFEKKNIQVPIVYLPSVQIPDFFFPSYDYYVFSTRIEKLQQNFYPLFFQDNILSPKNYLILTKYHQYLQNNIITRKYREQITFYTFLDQYAYTKFLIKDIKKNIDATNNDQNTKTKEYIYDIASPNKISNKPKGTLLNK